MYCPLCLDGYKELRTRDVCHKWHLDWKFLTNCPRRTSTCAPNTGHFLGRDTTATTSFDVTPRDWSSEVLPQLIVERIPNNLPSDPDSIADLGNIRHTIETGQRLLAVQHAIDSGPNEGFSFLTAIPLSLFDTIEVNYNALIDTSAFWRRQFDTTTVQNGTRWCGKDTVLALIPRVRRHEGTARDANSHAEFFHDTLQAYARDSTEQLVYSTLEFGAQQVLAAMSLGLQRATAANLLADDPLHNKFSIGCTLRFAP